MEVFFMIYFFESSNVFFFLKKIKILSTTQGDTTFFYSF